MLFLHRPQIGTEIYNKKIDILLWVSVTCFSIPHFYNSQQAQKTLHLLETGL